MRLGFHVSSTDEIEPIWSTICHFRNFASPRPVIEIDTTIKTPIIGCLFLWTTNFGVLGFLRTLSLSLSLFKTTSHDCPNPGRASRCPSRTASHRCILSLSLSHTHTLYILKLFAISLK